MTRNAIITLKKELKCIVRDKRSLRMMLVMPIMIPIFIFAFSALYDSEGKNNEDEIEKYNIGINYRLNDTEKEIIKDLNLEVNYYDNKEDLDKLYEEGEITAYILKNDKEYVIYYNPNTQDGVMASSEISMYLDELNNYYAEVYLNSINADINRVYANVSYSYEELTGKNEMIDYLIQIAFIYSIMAITLSTIQGATDLVAGEKEKGTLETILTFPLKNEELMSGKFLAITTSGIITSIVCTILIAISFLICSNMFSMYNDFIININPLTVSLGLLIMISYSIFISGAAIAIASFTKSYKEAQSALTPLSIVTIIPMFLEMLEIKMSYILSVIPIVNHTMLLTTVFRSTIGIQELIYLLIMFVSSAILSIILIKIIGKLFKSEKILFID